MILCYWISILYSNLKYVQHNIYYMLLNNSNLYSIKIYYLLRQFIPLYKFLYVLLFLKQIWMFNVIEK